MFVEVLGRVVVPGPSVLEVNGSGVHGDREVIYLKIINEVNSSI